MNLKKIIAVFVFTVLIAVTTLIAFAEDVTVGSQGAVVSSADPVVPVSTPQAPPQNESDTQWTWGEVINLDGAGKTITLKYLDYETDQEKEIALVVNEKTTFENIKSFNEIKIKDALSVDYTTGPDGKNIAKNIGFESSDVTPADTQVVPVQQSAANPEAAVGTSAAANAALVEPATQK